jgi:hypothetical protein
MKARVAARLQPCSLSELLQQLNNFGALWARQPSDNFGLELLSGATCRRQLPASQRRHVDAVGTTIAVMRLSRDQTARFEIVNQSHHHISVEGHGISELLLRLPIGESELAQQTKVTRVQSQRSQPLGKTGGAMVAELRQ